MKLLSIKLARAIWLFPTLDVNPRGKYMFPLLPALIDRYQFANVPDLQEAIKQQKGVKLGSGMFSYKKNEQLAVELGIYNDGLVGDSRSSTIGSEAFLADCLKFAVNEFGLKEPQSITRQFVSEVHVEVEQSLSTLNPRLAAFMKKLSGKVSATQESAYELSGLMFAGVGVGGRNPSPFRFERVENTVPSENRFWSFAPLATDDHLALLDDLVSILKK